MAFSTDKDKKIGGFWPADILKTPKNQIFENPKTPLIFLSLSHENRRSKKNVPVLRTRTKKSWLSRPPGETPAVTSVDDRARAACARAMEDLVAEESDLREAVPSVFFVLSVEVPQRVDDLSPDAKAPVTDSDDDDDDDDDDVHHACEAS